MKKISLELVRRDEVQVELDEHFFNEEWFAEFREHFYNFDSLRQLAEHIAFNVVHNNSRSIDGIGTPLRDGKRPYWLKEDDEVNEHVNIIFNEYDTEIEYE